MAQEKWITYAVEIQSAIQEMFEEGAANHIDVEELNDEENLKDFLHAIMNVVPSVFYTKLTGEEKNFLECNHVANQLCFEYMSNADDKQTKNTEP